MKLYAVTYKGWASHKLHSTQYGLRSALDAAAEINVEGFRGVRVHEAESRSDIDDYLYELNLYDPTLAQDFAGLVAITLFVTAFAFLVGAF